MGIDQDNTLVKTENDEVISENDEGKGENDEEVDCVAPLVGESNISKMREKSGAEQGSRSDPFHRSPGGQGYLRVPSRGTLSSSTTSTSLATECGSRVQLTKEKGRQDHGVTLHQDDHDYHNQEEEEFLKDQDNQEDDFDECRLHFQQLRQISINSVTKPRMEMETRGGAREENLRNAVPFVRQLSDAGKLGKGDFSINGDGSPYRPTTQRIYKMTQILAAIAVSFGSLVVGFSMGYTSTALESMMHENSTISVTVLESSWVGGLMPLAALFGGIIGGPMLENLGRRNSLLISAVPFIVSWLIIASATNIYLVYLGRALSGLCVGIGSLGFPVYLGETVQPEIRGQLGLLPTIFGNMGILISYFAGMYLDWSNLAYLGAVLPLPFLGMMFLIPETPRWFIASGKNDRAKKALQWLRGKDNCVEKELFEIVNAHNESEMNALKSPLIELTKMENLKPLLISLGLMFFQQTSGITPVIFYTVSIFSDAGLTMDSNACAIIVGIVNFLATFVTSFVVDKLGRKVLLYISSVTMTLALSILGAYFCAKTYNIDVSDFGWFLLLTFVVYIIAFSIGFGPIPWLMMGEILPARVRGTAASVATAFNWLCTFIMTTSFAPIKSWIGSGPTFWLFGGMCIMGLMFIKTYVPETQGKSLDDIERKLANRSRRANSIANTKPLPIGC